MSESNADAALGANRPLLLTDTARSWEVVRGVVEVFAVGGETDAPTPRLHLGTVAAGGRVFGIADGPGRTVRLLAVGGIDTVVRGVPMGPDDADERSAWVDGLAEALSGEDVAPPAPTAEVDPTARLEAAVNARRAEMEREGVARVRAQRSARATAMAGALDGMRALVDDEPVLPLTAEGDDPLDAAFAAVIRAHGLPAPEVPPGVTSGDRITLLARSARVRTRRVRLADGWWRQDSGPMVGYLSEGHQPVALVPRGATRYELIDPQTRSRTTVTADLAAAVEADAVVVYRPLPEGPLTIPALLRSALLHTRSDVLWLVGFSIASALVALTVPIVTGRIVGTVIPGADVPELVQLTLALAVSAIAGALFQVATATAVVRTQGRLDGYLVPAVWGRLLSLPTAFFRRYSAGDLAVRVQSVDAMVRLVGSGAVVALLGVATAVFSLALIWVYSTVFGVIATLLIAALGVIVWLSARAQYRRAQAVERTAGQLSGLVLELVAGIGKLRVAGAHEKAFQRWAERFRARRLAWNDVRRAQNVVTVSIGVFPILSSLVLFAVVGLSDSDAIPAGQFLAINAAFGQVVAAVVSIVMVATQLVQSAPAMKRMLPVIAEVPEDDAGKADPGVLRGAVEFSGVTFRYLEDGPVVLDDVSIRIAAGSSVALVGPSGSGKSTLGRLLLGFEVPEEGGVYLDDQDLAGLDLRAVRRQLGVVLQSVEPLPGTILTNILGDAVDLTTDDAWRAAEHAGLADDVRAMPMGMHTAITEGGSTLSGGQRQRLLIARALAGDPRVLLFDEATSALDNVTQSIVADSLAALTVTRIVIAHRLSTVRDVDRIYYLERGRVLESGSFEELMALGGRFAAQAQRQLA
ncbi:Alpha-hemolysin translocation ATP-binding protein HlyB [Microbacterium lemovicicum]|uniref:Alpha-hemolysin translocation ATP-binding protein HlyB n=1 Tax=Microbacterium lemovicicum TaxID=1072463 RepID=A0A3Q9IZM9_9MICO|nr:NHLP bacteriocin export ABC transporter permease/ATPase subunit [Microbacterium lemovicicum]AZS37516.1 Alpha-hemolysin translocation ATP-binding protein HlyB [Microbacterium lemovicicum]